MLDDSDTYVRCQGLTTLHAFLQSIPVKTLQSTGLASLFEDAVFPTLLFLPSVTPENESIQLLGPAYMALLALAERQASTSDREKLLDKLLREGVFAAYFHSGEHVRIVEVLAQHTISIIGAMGIQSVKHLKVRASSPLSWMFQLMLTREKNIIGSYTNVLGHHD